MDLITLLPANKDTLTSDTCRGVSNEGFQVAPTFIIISFLQLVNGEDGADMDTVQDGQQDLSQP